MNNQFFWISPLLAMLVALGLTPSPVLTQGANEKERSAKPTVRVAGIVLKWIRGDKEANWRRAEPLIREAAKNGALLVVTTECFLDGFAAIDAKMPLETYKALGESIPDGTYFRKMTALAAELKIYLAVGLTEADGDTRYNTVVLIGPDGKVIGRYRKQEVERNEAARNTAGKESPVFPTPFGRVGIVLCSERKNAALVRGICANGADFLLCPSGGFFGPKANDPIVQARSKENKVPIVFVNPAQFLVTGSDGSVLVSEVLGDRFPITKAEEGGKKDVNRVYYHDLTLTPRPAGAKAKSTK